MVVNSSASPKHLSWRQRPQRQERSQTGGRSPSQAFPDKKAWPCGEHASFASARAGTTHGHLQMLSGPSLVRQENSSLFWELTFSFLLLLLHDWQLSKPASIVKLHKTTPPCTLVILHNPQASPSLHVTRFPMACGLQSVLTQLQL